eukprot:848248-Lingulodinium_polyedra.AAC.1
MDARRKLLREEDRIRIGLDSPVEAGVHPSCPDGFPSLVEDASVDVLARELPLGELPVVVDILNLVCLKAAKASLDIEPPTSEPLSPITAAELTSAGKPAALQANYAASLRLGQPAKPEAKLAGRRG